MSPARKLIVYNLLDRGFPLLSLGPEHAATIARDGYDKPAIRAFIFEHARFPLGRLGDEYRSQQVTRHGVVDDPATMVPIVESPDAISIIVVGGAGKHSSWQPTSWPGDPKRLHARVGEAYGRDPAVSAPGAARRVSRRGAGPRGR